MGNASRYSFPITRYPSHCSLTRGASNGAPALPTERRRITNRFERTRLAAVTTASHRAAALHDAKHQVPDHVDEREHAQHRQHDLETTIGFSIGRLTGLPSFGHG